ncbi:hypothetical protein SBRCBS47491_004548 [Sporothrix bragantina]|uniref:Transcription factor domain-containing protein n=1 Tax=Sporothrix bragantina TaxID=671064 RepID=A0ABP0BPY6_9PEZI
MQVGSVGFNYILDAPPVSLEKDEVRHTGGSSSGQFAACRSQPSATCEENPTVISDHGYETITVEDLDSLVVANSLATISQCGVECPSSAHDGHDDVLLQRLSQVPTTLQDIYLQFAGLDVPAIDIDMAAFGDMFDLDIAGYWQLQDAADTAQLMPQLKRRSRLDPSIRSEAFRRSPWAYWHPSKLHHAFTGQEAIDARPADADAAASPLTARTLNYTILDALDEGGRDRILQVVTSLKDPRAFCQSYYNEPPALKPDRNAEDHEHQWKDWTTKESLKRLALRAFVYDSQVAMGYFQLPAISFAQLSMPVPAPAGWWLAEDALHWRECIVCLASGAREPPLMKEVFNDLTVLDKYSDQTDIQLCCFVAVHVLANQVGELRQHMMLLATMNGAKQRRVEAWCINRQRDLYEDLTAARMYCERRAPHPEIGLLLEYAMMSLYVSLEDIQRYAGQEGEGEALKLAPTLNDWSQTSAARTAIWHAGQVFRIARRFPPSTLRNVYALALYRAALTLWVYSLLRNGDRASGVSTPLVAPFNAAETVASHNRTGTTGISNISLAAPAVKLDQGEDEDVRVFLLLGLGTPGLCHSLSSSQEGETVECPGSIQAQLNPSPCQFRSLTSPAFPMEVAKEILQNNALFACESPSLLVQNLVVLMGDLQSLSQNGNADPVDPNID